MGKFLFFVILGIIVFLIIGIVKGAIDKINNKPYNTPDWANEDSDNIIGTFISKFYYVTYPLGYYVIGNIISLIINKTKEGTKNEE